MAGNRKKSTKTTSKASEKGASRRSRALRDIENNVEQDSNRVDNIHNEQHKNKDNHMVDPPRNSKRQRKMKQSYMEDPITSDDNKSSINGNDEDDNSEASSFSNEPVKKGGKNFEKSNVPKTKGKTNSKTKVAKVTKGKFVKAVKVSLSPSVRSIDISPTQQQDDTIILRDWRVSGALDY